MSPLKATRNSDTVTLLIRDDSNVGAALIHSAFRDIASLTRWGADKMESRIFDIWPWHCLLQKPDHTSVLALECCTLNIRKPQRITISNSKLLDQISNIQSSYANTDNSGHETDEGSFWYLGFIWFAWQIQWVTIVGNVCIYREMRLGIKIPELSEALFRKSVLDCKSRGDLCPCSLIGSYPWPLDCNFLWKGLNFGPTWNWWKDAFAIRIIWK